MGNQIFLKNAHPDKTVKTLSVYFMGSWDYIDLRAFTAGSLCLGLGTDSLPRSRPSMCMSGCDLCHTQWEVASNAYGKSRLVKARIIWREKRLCVGRWILIRGSDWL